MEFLVFFFIFLAVLVVIGIGVWIAELYDRSTRGDRRLDDLRRSLVNRGLAEWKISSAGKIEFVLLPTKSDEHEAH